MKLHFLRGSSSVAILFLCGCVFFARHPTENILVGAWTNTLGATWMLKTDGTFDVDLTHRGHPDLWGKYDIAGDQITLTRSGGLKPKGCDGKGVYRFALNNGRLKFTLIEDDCWLRKKNLLLDWKRK